MKMSTDDPVDIGSLPVDDPRRFLLATQPIVTVTRDLADAVRRAIDRFGGVVGADSPAMEEIAEEARWKPVDEWETPVGTALSIGVVSAIASAEDLRCYGRLFEHAPPPLYGHLTLARSVIETSVTTRWIMEPAIGALARVKRSLVQMLGNARTRPVVKDFRQQAREQDERIRRVAAAYGWSATGARHPAEVDGVGAPSPKRVLSEVVVGDPDRALGPIIYNWLSGAVHGDVATWLMDAETLRQDANGAGQVMLGLSSDTVALVTIAMLTVYLSALDNVMALTGWAEGDRATAQARVDADELIRVLRRGHGWN
jgi:hypothetical protein